MCLYCNIKYVLCLSISERLQLQTLPKTQAEKSSARLGVKWFVPLFKSDDDHMLTAKVHQLNCEASCLVCLLLLNTRTKHCPCGSFATCVFHRCNEYLSHPHQKRKKLFTDKEQLEGDLAA